MVVLTSRFTMDARNPAARRDIASLADLVGVIRLPGGAHQRAAGTDVVTDLLVLRRREPGREPDSTAWEKTRHAELDGAQVPVNEYFLDSPEAVLGQMGAVHGAYRADDLVVRPSGDTITAFTAALDALTCNARLRGLTYSPADHATDTSRPAAEAARSAQPDGYLRAGPDGTFTKVVSGTGQPHAVPASQAAELRQLLALRDSACALLAAEAASAEDTPGIGELRAALDRHYDHYLATYGPLNRFWMRRTGRTNPANGEPVMARIRPRQGGFAGDPFAPLVYALEEFDPVGQRAAKATIFRERVIAPRTPRLGADTPADALAICLDTRGEARLDEIARLLGTTDDDAREQLGTLVFDDPATGQLTSRRRVPVREGPRQAAASRAGRRGRPRVRGQRHRTARRDPPRPHARRDRRAARRGVDRRQLHPAIPAGDTRRPGLARRASRRADLDGTRQPRHCARPLNVGHQPVPRPGSRASRTGTAQHPSPRHGDRRRRQSPFGSQRRRHHGGAGEGR